MNTTSNVSQMAPHIALTVNGEPRTVSAGGSLMEVVESVVSSGQRFAVEVNGEIVPRGQLGEYRPQEGDRVEIVQAIGGG